MRYTWGSALLQLARNKLLHGLFGVEGENHLLQVKGKSCPRRSELGCPPGALLLLLFSLPRAESTRVKAQLFTRWKPLPCRTSTSQSNSLSNKKAGLKTPSSFREEKRDGGGWKAPDKHHSASANPAVLRQDNINSPTALHIESFKCFQTFSRPNVFTEIGCLLLAREKGEGRGRKD